MDLVTEEKFSFGFCGPNRKGINHILLEFKKHVLYNWKSEIGVIAFCELLRRKIRSLIIKEKYIAQQNDNFSTFNNKWENYTSIYDFRGPDVQIYS